MKYNWDPEEYKKSSTNQKRWGEELLSKIPFKGNEKVLDIGCGDGKLTTRISQMVPDGYVMGIDNSQDMINLAKNSYPKKEYPNLDFILMDARDISFENEFDIIFSNASLHWIKEHLNVLKRIQRSLKKDGRIYLQMGGKGNASSIIEILENKIKDEKWKKHFKSFSFPYGFYSSEEYEEWLNIAGLTPETVILIEKDMVHKDLEALKSWLRTTWLPYTQRVPESIREDFIEEIAKSYIEIYPPYKDGTIHIRMVRLEVIAKKV